MSLFCKWKGVKTRPTQKSGVHPLNEGMLHGGAHLLAGFASTTPRRHAYCVYPEHSDLALANPARAMKASHHADADPPSR